MSDPTLSDIDFKNKMAWMWTTLNKAICVSILLEVGIDIQKRTSESWFLRTSHISAEYMFSYIGHYMTFTYIVSI